MVINLLMGVVLLVLAVICVLCVIGDLGKFPGYLGLVVLFVCVLIGFDSIAAATGFSDDSVMGVLIGCFAGGFLVSSIWEKISGLLPAVGMASLGLGLLGAGRLAEAIIGYSQYGLLILAAPLLILGLVILFISGSL